jgi:NAD-dependent SIR2 family protein deacetylase
MKPSYTRGFFYCAKCAVWLPPEETVQLGTSAAPRCPECHVRVRTRAVFKTGPRDTNYI